jgi:hypothetical protein
MAMLMSIIAITIPEWNCFFLAIYASLQAKDKYVPLEDNGRNLP